MKKKGFLAIDAIISMAICAVVVVSIASVTYSQYRYQQFNNHYFSSVLAIENHLEDVAGRTDWSLLDGQTEQVDPKISCVYTLTDTEYGTLHLALEYNTEYDTYQFFLERCNPDD